MEAFELSGRLKKNFFFLTIYIDKLYLYTHAHDSDMSREIGNDVLYNKKI